MLTVDNPLCEQGGSYSQHIACFPSHQENICQIRPLFLWFLSKESFSTIWTPAASSLWAEPKCSLYLQQLMPSNANRLALNSSPPTLIWMTQGTQKKSSLSVCALCSSFLSHEFLLVFWTLLVIFLLKLGSSLSFFFPKVKNKMYQFSEEVQFLRWREAQKQHWFNFLKCWK